MADAIWAEKNMRAFQNRVEAKDKPFVAAMIITTLDQLRGLDGVMLAEAVAGAPEQERLIDLYLQEEGALSGLEYVHQEWSNR